MRVSKEECAAFIQFHIVVKEYKWDEISRKEQKKSIEQVWLAKKDITILSLA